MASLSAVTGCGIDVGTAAHTPRKIRICRAARSRSNHSANTDGSESDRRPVMRSARRSHLLEASGVSFSILSLRCSGDFLRRRLCSAIGDQKISAALQENRTPRNDPLGSSFEKWPLTPRPDHRGKYAGFPQIDEVQRLFSPAFYHNRNPCAGYSPFFNSLTWLPRVCR